MAENGIQWASSLSWLARDGVVVCGMFIVALPERDLFVVAVQGATGIKSLKHNSSYP
ncbi:hypothetical protein D3C84_1286410 [compost metagenome]